MEIITRKFNELTREEMYNIFRLRSEVFVVEQNCVYNDLDGKDKDAIHIFAKENGRIVAYIRTFVRQDGSASFGRVCVSKDHRRSGLGKKIVAEGIRCICENYDHKKIHNRIMIEAQEYLRGFYESFGFRKTSETYLEDGIPHIDMQMDLN